LLVLAKEFAVFLQNSSHVEPKKKKTKINVKPDNSHRTCHSPCALNLGVERLRDILENIPFAVVVLEKPNGKVTYANKRAIKLQGFNPCGIELTTHPGNLKILTLDGKVCPTEELNSYKALFKEETIRNSTLIIEQPSGKQVIVVVSAKPLYDREGTVNAAVVVFENVTGHVKTQNALAESEERLKMAQKIAHVGSWEYYVKEDRAIWSEELFRIFGLKLQQYGPNTKEYLALIYPKDRELMNKTMEQMLFTDGLSANASFDYRIIHEDGSLHTIHSERMVREVDKDTKPTRIVGVEQDITDRKQIEQKLEEYAENLEQLVEERTKQLKDAERFAAIGQTASMIGHDIRNPLQTIAGELYLMKQDVDASADTECKSSMQESLVSIQEQIDYMNKIISDLQDFARPLKPDLVEVELCSAIPQLVETVNVPDNIEANAVCESNMPKIKLDLTFLKRILVNLATNAVQAMPDGGKLTIRTSKEANCVAITVSDTGVGIPEEVKTKLFQPLFTTKAKGQGFGLAVVKRLVEAQGGTITFESWVGEGTQFKMVFPAASQNQPS
jgi:PAS domain S-box-containing protein